MADNCPMPQIQLTPAQRKAHRALAHHLTPVVFIGHEGLTPAVLREAGHALTAHGLIKIRVFSDDRSAREAMLVALAWCCGARCPKRRAPSTKSAEPLRKR